MFQHAAGEVVAWFRWTFSPALVFLQRGDLGEGLANCALPWMAKMEVLVWAVAAWQGFF